MGAWPKLGGKRHFERIAFYAVVESLNFTAELCFVPSHRYLHSLDSERADIPTDFVADSIQDSENVTGVPTNRRTVSSLPPEKDYF